MITFKIDHKRDYNSSLLFEPLPNDDVVNIVPIVGRNLILEEFLNIKVKSFNIKQYSSGNGNDKRILVGLSLTKNYR